MERAGWMYKDPADGSHTRGCSVVAWVFGFHSVGYVYTVTLCDNYLDTHVDCQSLTL